METTIGIAGVGIEYEWQAQSKDLPPLTRSFEVGLGMVSFDNYGIFSNLTLGSSIYYKF